MSPRHHGRQGRAARHQRDAGRTAQSNQWPRQAPVSADPPSPGGDTGPAGAMPPEESAAVVLIRPRDPLVLRDARPFSAEPGARAVSLPFPMPRTVAGAVRTHLGTSAGFDWTRPESAAAARAVVCHGPLLVGQREPGSPWTAYVPAPRDVVFHRDYPHARDLRAMALRPQSLHKDEGCDFPEPPPGNDSGYARAMANADLRPLVPDQDVKPESRVPAWWGLEDAFQWLAAPDAGEAKDRLRTMYTSGERESMRGIAAPPPDIRIHVSIDPDMQTNLEGALFTTESRAFRDAPDGEHGHPALGLLCTVSSKITLGPGLAFLPLGGERRLAGIAANDPLALWPEVCWPTDDEFAATTGLRLLLVTPALFAHGWLPGWMADGVIPGTKGLKAHVRLVGATIERRIPVSGWRIAWRTGERAEAPPGPRATRYAVPAGGVYFFEFANPAPDLATKQEIWKRLWLASVSDTNIDRDEGFGLVLPGLWRRDDTQSGERS